MNTHLLDFYVTGGTLPPGTPSYVERSADAEFAHACPNLFDQALGDALLHEKARTGTTDLSLVEPDPIDESLYGAVEISVIEDDEWRFAAEFE